MNKNRMRLRDAVFALVLAALLYVKGRLFYPPLQLAGYDAAFSLATAAILLLLFALVSFSPRGLLGPRPDASTRSYPCSWP